MEENNAKMEIDPNNKKENMKEKGIGKKCRCIKEQKDTMELLKAVIERERQSNRGYWKMF